MNLSRPLALFSCCASLIVAACGEDRTATKPPPQAQKPPAAAPEPAQPAPPPAAAQDGHALAQKYGCLACHAIDRKAIGPSFNDVAAKYRGQAGVEGKLVHAVRQGSQGLWGPAPMPPNAHVPEQDARMVVDWILALK
jgi:cytochrome c551/c552